MNNTDGNIPTGTGRREAYEAYPMDPAAGYRDFYLRTIALRCRGFKPVPGGTGLGKTHGLMEAIARQWESKTVDRQFIYVSHRKNLLDEMEEKLQKREIPCLRLWSDSELMEQVLHDEQLELSLYAFLKDGYVKKAVKALTDKQKHPKSLLDPRFILDRVLHCKGLLSLMAEGNPKVIKLLDPSKEFSFKTGDIFRFVARLLTELGKTAAQETDPHKLTEGYRSFLRRHRTLFYHLFPFMHFREQHKQQPVLITTLHKLYNGFFDGNQNGDISRLEGYVLFLDEFDFLEPELRKKLCAIKDIPDPVHFIKVFSQGFTAQLRDSNFLPQRHEREGQEAAVATWAFQEIEATIGSINQLKQRGYAFPLIERLVMEQGEELNSLRSRGIFLSSFLAVSRPIGLRDDEPQQRMLVQVGNKPGKKDSLSALTLMREVKSITQRILHFYAQLRNRDLSLFEELLDTAYSRTDYKLTLERQSPFFSMLGRGKKQFREGASYYLNQLYLRGYSLFALEDHKQLSEPNAVRLESHNLHTTPEYLLLHLLSQNMVFGLSATAVIPRIVDHFHEDWLAQVSAEVFGGKNTAWLRPDARDAQLISALSEQKAAARACTVALHTCDKTVGSTVVSNLIETLRHDKHVKDIKNNTYHPQRLAYFFNTLDWIIAHPYHDKHLDKHLLFLNSFKQIRYWLDLKQESMHYQSLGEDWVCYPSPLGGEPEGANYFYKAAYRGHTFKIALLDKSSAAMLYQEKGSHFFYEDCPTLVVTQYPSSQNGVNLQFYPSASARQQEAPEDFRSIHLLDAPYFYFGRTQRAEDSDDYEKRPQLIREDIWKVAQLYASEKIDLSRFNWWMDIILGKEGDSNQLYSELPDYLCNQVARLIQALGRVERVGHRSVGEQRVCLSPEVLQILSRFAQHPQFARERGLLAPWQSDFMRQVLAACAERSSNQEVLPGTSIGQASSAFRRKLETYVQEVFPLIRKQPANHKQEVNQWHDFRKALLRHEYQNPLLQDFGAIIQQYQVEGSEANQYRTPLTDRMYEVLEGLPGALRHFKNHNFKLGFADHGHGMQFVPACLKTLLAGFFAEEVVLALLREAGETVCRPEEVYPAHFELADLLIAERELYIDVKNYSKKTLRSIYFQDQEAIPTEQEILSDMQKRLETIRITAPKARLAWLVFRGSTQQRARYYYANGQACHDPQEAAILFLPGLVQKDKDTKLFVTREDTKRTIQRLPTIKA